MSITMERQMTDLDLKLQEIATKNWFQFVGMMGNDAYIAMKICLLRQQNKSYGEIGIRLGITEAKVRWWCGECDTKPG